MPFIQSIQKFIRDEEGAVAIEYALVAAGIAAVVYAAFVADTGSIKALLSTLIGNITTAATGK